MVSVQRTHHIYMAGVLVFAGVFIFIIRSSSISTCKQDPTTLSKPKDDTVSIEAMLLIAAFISVLRFRISIEVYSCLEQQQPRNIMKEIKNTSRVLSSELLNVIIYTIMSFIFPLFLSHNNLKSEFYIPEDCISSLEALIYFKCVLFLVLISSVTMSIISARNFVLIWQTFRQNVNFRRGRETSEAGNYTEEMQVINSFQDPPPAYEA